jgi:prephenate dehydratase
LQLLASEEAANIFGFKNYKNHTLPTNKKYYTRFLIAARKQPMDVDYEYLAKTSIVMATDQKQVR